MIKNRKVIGVCLTKIQDIRRADYISKLHSLCEEADCKMMIFNSFVDYYNDDAFDEGEKSIYGIINYDIVDVLVVLYDSFSHKAVADDIISGAKERGVPVILINGKMEGCWSICTNYEVAYKHILTHVIANHKISDTFYIAGTKTDEDSVKRIGYYREVLEENGIEFDESRIAYGQYWEGPVKVLIRDMVSDGKKPPKAIFCANDYMTFAACNELKKHGYIVPDDVIVTGFDGVPASEYFSPQLTTCSEDLDYLAELTMQTVDRCMVESTTDDLIYCHQPIISESCGCHKLSDVSFRETSLELSSLIDEMDTHENFIYSCIDHMMEIDDMNDLRRCISKCIPGDSYVCLNGNFVATVIDWDLGKKDNCINDELVIIGSSRTYGEQIDNPEMNVREMIPCIEKWLESDQIAIMNAIHVGGEVFGYFVARTNDIREDKIKIKRVMKAITIAFNVAINHFRQVKMRLSIETADLTNSITRLPNFKGTAKWFEEFASIPENRKKTMTVSVYGLRKYTYISENFGIAAAEEAVRYVGEALRIANPKDCFIGHIGEDEFVIINYYDTPDTISAVINSATSVFFNIMDGYNASNDKKYFVEVNCGCTVIDADWTGSLESFVKFANSEMYMNRLKMGIGVVLKEEDSPKIQYKAFELLIDNNLFYYHFQPIVSAKTGEIYAYEALMRTDKIIGMNPLEVLDTAREYNRLYDIEKATVKNVMEAFVSNREAFGDKFVFINTIPGYFLREDELAKVKEKYGEHMGSFMFELTEQNSVSDEELNSIKELCGQNHVVIDDYGAGHSNIVNLIRYAPEVIKIDRFLISDIHKDQNKQMFVRSTIEFAKLNNIKVLAEGVETSNELHMVIDLGVDYIQGYYTGRPSAEIVPSIAQEIRQEIITANPLWS